MTREAFDPAFFDPDELEAHPELLAPEELTEKQLLQAVLAFAPTRELLNSGLVYRGGGDPDEYYASKLWQERVTATHAAAEVHQALARRFGVYGGYLRKWKVRTQTGAFLPTGNLIEVVQEVCRGQPIDGATLVIGPETSWATQHTWVTLRSTVTEQGLDVRVREPLQRDLQWRAIQDHLERLDHEERAHAKHAKRATPWMKKYLTFLRDKACIGGVLPLTDVESAIMQYLESGVLARFTIKKSLKRVKLVEAALLPENASRRWLY